MSKEKFFLGFYMILFAAGAIAIQVIAMSSSAALYVFETQPRPQYIAVRPVVPKENIKNKVAENTVPCIPKYSADGSIVGGLEEIRAPKLPSALRTNYDNNGTSQYSAHASEQDIFNYYLPEIAGQCWEIAAIAPQKMEWRKDDKIFQIAVLENSLGAKTLVDYRMYGAGVVLGETYKAAQVTCTGDQIYCAGYNGSSGYCQPSGTTCPPPPTTTTPPPTTTSCPPPPMCGNAPYIYDASGCSTGCGTSYTPPLSSITCSGTYQQPNITSPSCNWSQCSSGCTWDPSGCPSGCQPSSGTNTGTGSCSGGQIWCPSQSGTGGWCQMPPCPSSGGTYSSCPSGQYMCNGVCKPTSDTNCPGSGSTSGSCSGGQTWCSSSSGTGGWCQMPPCPSSSGTSSMCPSGQYWCPGTSSCKPVSDTYCPTTGGGSPASCPSGQYMCNNTCVANGTTCNNYQYYPPGNTNTTQCPSGSYYCQPTNNCVPNNSPCGGTQTTQQPQAQPVSCPQCQVSQNGQCVRAPFGTSDSRCGTKGVCDENGGCIILKTGQTAVGNGAICGNGFCDMNKGENKLNCPAECDNLPPGGIPSNTNQQNQPWADMCSNNTQVTCIDSSGNTAMPKGKTKPPICPEGMTWKCLPANQQQYNSNMPNRQQGQNGQMGPGGQNGQMGPGGPSEEDMQKMDQQRFEQMKKGLSQFSKGITQMTKMVSKNEKKLLAMGVAIPEELKAALAAAPALVERIKNAKTADELDEIISDVEDVGMAMQEWGPRFGDLMRLGSMMKQMDKDVKNILKSLKKAQGYAKSNPTLQDSAAELNDIYTSMLEASKAVKELAKTDPDSALDKIDEEFYGRMEEFWNRFSLIEMLRNLKTGLNQANKDIKRYEATIKQLVKKKMKQETIDELRQAVVDMKEKLAGVKALSLQKGADPEDIKLATEELWQMMSDFENQVSDLGAGYYEPKVTGGENMKFQMPQGFMGETSAGQPIGQAPMGPGGLGF